MVRNIFPKGDAAYGGRLPALQWVLSELGVQIAARAKNDGSTAADHARRRWRVDVPAWLGIAAMARPSSDNLRAVLHREVRVLRGRRSNSFSAGRRPFVF